MEVVAGKVRAQDCLYQRHTQYHSRRSLTRGANSKKNYSLGYGEDALTDNKCCAEGKEQSRRKKEEELYDALDEMQPIAVKDGLLLFVVISSTLAPSSPLAYATITMSKNVSPLPPNPWES
jgi:hypothetical protein